MAPARADADRARAELRRPLRQRPIGCDSEIHRLRRERGEIDVAAGQIQREELQPRALQGRAQPPLARGRSVPGIVVRRRRHQFDAAEARRHEIGHGGLGVAVEHEAERMRAEVRLVAHAPPSR